jgi:hypothetical protein
LININRNEKKEEEETCKILRERVGRSEGRNKKKKKRKEGIRREIERS